MANQLEGKVAVITGGGSGIGRACAVRFAREGADVVVGDIHRDQGEETVRLVEQAGRLGLFVLTDTTSEGDCDALVAAAVAEFGHVDVGVASAGISHAQYVSGADPRRRGAEQQEAGTVVNLLTEDFRRVLDVNVVGVMQTDRALARQMLAQGRGGSIVNIASSAAKIPLPGASPYCVSKAAVWMLTKVMGTELAATGVRVNAVGPGYTDTPMTTAINENPDVARAAMSITPMNRMGTPEEIAAACLFLASDEASFFTAQMIHPAGGQFTD